MDSKIEPNCSRHLLALLKPLSDQDGIPEGTAGFREFASGLEYILPPILAEVYDHWSTESLDGFVFSTARRIGPESAELIGMAILINDQTVTPVHILLQVDPERDEINWMECRIGEPGKGKGGMNRLPFGSPKADKWFRQLSAGNLPPSIDWVYMAGYGERR